MVTNTYVYRPGGQLESEETPQWASSKVTLAHTSRLRTSLTLQQPTIGNWTHSYVWDSARRLDSLGGKLGQLRLRLHRGGHQRQLRLAAGGLPRVCGLDGGVFPAKFRLVSAEANAAKITVRSLVARKGRARIAALTACDFPMAKLLDDAGRRTMQVEDQGTGKLNRTTSFAYNADDRLTTLTATNATTGNQATKYFYGTTLSESDVASNDLLRSTIYPDSADTDPTGTDQVKLAYNRLGEVKSQTDQAGTVHILEYDKLGRLLHDRVTTFGTNVDQTVKRTSRTYEVRGMLLNITSYDNATVGSGSVVNDVQYAYNTFSQLTTEYQSHSGAVNTGTSPKVQYAYANGSANHIRLTSLTYPNAQVNTYDYGTGGGADDLLSRVTSILQSTTHLVDYTYLGVGEIVQANYSSQPGVALTYIMQSGDSTGDAGDQYIGLDRFNRVVDQRWIKTSTLAAQARIQYGFDRNSNRTFRDDLVAGTGQDEFYTYDNLDQLKTLQRGTLNGTRTGLTGTPTWEENFNFDDTGNWHGASSGYLTKTNGVTGLDQNRANSKANEINGITTATGTAWSVPSYDAAGNMTSMPQPGALNSAYTGIYDAWNRLVQLKNGAATVATYRYDGANRRVTKLIGANTRHYYYSSKWQILEERLNVATTADRQFVWGLRYDDDLILRDCSNISPTRLYVLHDYFHPVALTDTSAAVQERYGYNAYGATNVMTSAFAVRASTSYDWETRFGAYRWDGESGLYQVRYRYTHPLLGCWLSRDPLDYEDGVNLYTYCRNESVNGVDPFGLFLGFGYGNWCGYSRWGQDGDPEDDVDRACCKHDVCLKTTAEAFKFKFCNIRFCKDVAKAKCHGDKKCKKAKRKILAGCALIVPVPPFIHI